MTAPAGAGVRTDRFGTLPDGRPVHRFTLVNANGLIIRVAEFGTIITEVHAPDRSGQPADVVLGFDHLDPYLRDHPYFGCTVGRVANRIAGGRFVLDGVEYFLTRNDGPHHLHGGHEGLDKVLWAGTVLSGAPAGVRFSHTSPDGHEGYPGRLDLTVTMVLDDADTLTIDFFAAADRPTPVNLTNHSYFNLAGHGDVLGHELQLRASAYTPTGADLIPTGEILPVRGTPLDFLEPEAIGRRFGRTHGASAGLDHNFVIDRADDGLTLAARLREPQSGRVLQVSTTQPGLQVYTGNALDGTCSGKRGAGYARHAGVCLETQHFPDAVNHPAFPSVILRPGHAYRQSTSYRFTAE